MSVDPHRWITLAVVLTATFMGLLDTFIVNVSVPSIQRDLHAGFAEVQFVLAGYTLAYAIVLTTGGRLGDLYGRKLLFLAGMAGFILASAFCGFASNPAFLIVFRVIQGVMAALMLPQVLSIIQVSFLPKERGLALGLYGATVGAAAILGQVVGGLLITANFLGLGWRPIFLVNVPLGLVAFVATLLLLRESHAPGSNELDLVGMGLVSVGLFLLVYPLVESRIAAWPWWLVLCLILSLLVLATFALYEHWLTRHGHTPLVALSLFGRRAFTVGILMVLTLYGSSAGFFLVFAYYLQEGLRFSALSAGLTFLPMGIGFFLASATASRLVPKLGRGVLTLGVFTTITQIANALGVAVIGLIFANVVGRNGAYAHGFAISLLVILALGMLLFLCVFFLPSKRTQ
ncbi:MAG: MFS transporter [Ktedonobacteraceae bacterium]|nr:MFS transporter [Ktedonobacteraceae bacterium]